ncbi:MAG TPA: hypothetical protein VFV78_05110 [Vicinamibacterales bacterium]|nr:hypothetical protein [Vicinamibacterales bacterium]
MAVRLALSLVLVAAILPSAAERGAFLFDALGSDVSDAELREGLSQVPAPLRQSLESRLARKKSFQSTLTPVSPRASFEERVVFRRRLEVERGAFALATRADAARDAAEFARAVRLSYEWEGYPDGPMAEAQSAEKYLASQPGTAVKDYVQLFLMHRYRCAFEAAERTLSEKALAAEAARTQRESAAAYRQVWDQVSHSRDVVTAAVAKDLDAARFIYLSSREHPRTFRGG